jgi:hypothetical protein
MQSFMRWLRSLTAVSPGEDDSKSPLLESHFAATVRAKTNLQPATSGSQDRFEAIIDLGFRAIPAVAWPRTLSLQLTATRIRFPRFVAVSFCSHWPTFVNEVVNVFSTSYGLTDRDSRMWLAACGFITTTMFLASWGAWNQCRKAAAPIGKMLSTSPNRATIEDWLLRRMSLPAQLVVAAPAGVLLCVILRLSEAELEPAVPVGFASYLMTFWLGAVAINAVYWLCIVGDFARRLRRCKGLELNWHDPAMTPGLVALCDAYIYCASALSVGVIVTEAAAISLPKESPAGTLAYLAIFFPVMAGLVTLWAAIQPFFPLYLMARDAKRLTLTELTTTLASAPPGDYSKIFDLYFQVRVASLLPVNTATVVQYSAAIIGVVGGFTIPRVFGILGSGG